MLSLNEKGNNTGGEGDGTAVPRMARAQPSRPLPPSGTCDNALPSSSIQPPPDVPNVRLEAPLLPAPVPAPLPRPQRPLLCR